MRNWDNEIDDVAKQMTDGDPDAGFRARVLAGLDAAEGSWWTRRWFAVWSRAAVAAAAIAIAVVVFYPRRHDVATTGSDVRLKPDTTGASDVRLKPDATGAIADGRLRPDATGTIAANGSIAEPPSADVRRTTSLSSSSVASGFSRTSDVADANGGPYAVALLAPPPIAIEPLGLDAMEAMDSIDINALAVAPLTVPPLSVAAMGE